MIRSLRILLLMSLPMAINAAPIDTVVAAFDAEGNRPIERIRLFVERGGVADVYYIDRVRPDRLRMLKNPRQGGIELRVIGGTQWLRTAAGWQKSSMLATASIPSFLSGMFRDGLTDAVENARPDGSRSVEGRLSWTNGTRCDGKVMLRIGPDGLPSLLSFDGACGGRPARFRQAFSFDGPLSITPPE